MTTTVSKSAAAGLHTRPWQELQAIFDAVPAVSGMGGPLLRDFHLALELDALIAAYDCDAIIETGTHFGETAEYLARAYPDLAIHTCEIHDGCYHESARRLAHYSNMHLWHGSSPTVLARLTHYARPLYFLDAHWEDYWPLLDELRTIRAGVVCIHDFDVGDEAFGFDTYGGVVNGPRALAGMHSIYGNLSHAAYPTSSPGILRRGRGFLAIGLDQRLDGIPYLRLLDGREEFSS